MAALDLLLNMTESVLVYGKRFTFNHLEVLWARGAAVRAMGSTTITDLVGHGVHVSTDKRSANTAAIFSISQATGLTPTSSTEVFQSQRQSRSQSC